MRHSARSRRPLAALVTVIALAAGLPACTGAGLVVGAGAAAVTAGQQERGFSQAVDDNRIAVAINGLLFKKHYTLFAQVKTQVTEGVVLLTGTVVKPADRVAVTRLVWQVDGVREVINEITVTETGGLVDQARDTLITGQLKLILLGDDKVASINYSITTVNGVVYLTGLAANDAELARVVNHARSLKYVRRVVNYTRLKNDPRRAG